MQKSCNGVQYTNCKNGKPKITKSLFQTKCESQYNYSKCYVVQYIKVGEDDWNDQKGSSLVKYQNWNALFLSHYKLEWIINILDFSSTFVESNIDLELDKINIILHRASFPYSFLVEGINNRAGLNNDSTRPDHEKESGEFLLQRYTYNWYLLKFYYLVNPTHEYKTIEMSIFLGINGAYEHAMSVVGVFFILITIAVAYIIRRKRSERGKDKLILRTFVDAFYV